MRRSVSVMVLALTMSILLANPALVTGVDALATGPLITSVDASMPAWAP